MGTNPNNLVGTNGAYGGRTSVNAFNDVLSAFTTAGVVSGWNCAPQSGMVVQLGGDSLSRDVAIAEDPFGNRTTINNREGEPVPVEISAASATTQRIDCVVAYVNSPATVQSTTLDNPEAVGIIDVKGSASSEPDDEAIRDAITADGGTGSTAYYVILATITVPAGATSITAGEIAQGAATMTEILANSVKSDNIDWATMQDFKSEVTLVESPSSYTFLRFGKLVVIQYFGESKSHARDDVLFRVPSWAVPKTSTGLFLTSFATSNGDAGLIQFGSDRAVTVFRISTATVGRVTFSVAYFIS